MEESISYELMTLWGEAGEYVEKHEFEKAIQIYKYIVLMYSESPEAAEHANAYLADTYLTLRKPDLSKEHILRALKLNPDHPQYHYILGFTYTLQSEWKEAVQQFEICLLSLPDKAEYLRGLGWATYNTGEREQGILILNKALRIEPDDTNILTDLAVSYLGVGNFRLARKYTRMALKIDPDSSLARGTMWMVDYAEHQAHMEEE